MKIKEVPMAQTDIKLKKVDERVWAMLKEKDLHPVIHGKAVDYFSLEEAAVEKDATPVMESVS